MLLSSVQEYKFYETSKAQWGIDIIKYINNAAEIIK